jgi:putative phage-type endonuclease
MTMTAEVIKSDQWIAEHRRTIGSSVAAAVIGEHPYMSPMDAYLYMAGLADTVEPNADMERGVLLESIARRKLAEHLGAEIEPQTDYGFVYHEAYPWAHALPDGWIKGHPVPVELKVPRPEGWQKLRLEGMHGYWFVQCQHQIALCDVAKLEFGALHPVTMQILPITVQRDDEFIALMMKREAEFYKRLQRGAPPPEEPAEKIDIPEFQGELLRDTSDEARASACAYIEADQILTDAQALKDSAKARLVALMGEHGAVEFPGLRCYCRFRAGRTTLDKKALQADGIDISKYEKTGNPFTEFRAYRLGR